jgi:hypothetical protein
MDAPNIKKNNYELLQEISSMIKTCKTDITDIRQDIHYVKNNIKINKVINKPPHAAAEEPLMEQKEKGWFWN